MLITLENCVHESAIRALDKSHRAIVQIMQGGPLKISLGIILPLDSFQIYIQSTELVQTRFAVFTMPCALKLIHKAS